MCCVCIDYTHRMPVIPLFHSMGLTVGAMATMQQAGKKERDSRWRKWHEQMEGGAGDSRKSKLLSADVWEEQQS